MGVLDCVEEIMRQMAHVDRISGTYDQAMLLLDRYKTHSERKKSFVPSRLWG